MYDISDASHPGNYIQTPPSHATKLAPKRVRKPTRKINNLDQGGTIPNFADAMQSAIGSPQLPRTLNILSDLGSWQTALEADVELLEEEIRVPLLAILAEEQARLSYLVTLLQGQSK